MQAPPHSVTPLDGIVYTVYVIPVLVHNVPVRFCSRHLHKFTGTISGMNVLRIINEPLVLPTIAR